MSKRATFKEFHKQYEAYLLRAPHANYTLGDFAEIEKRFWLDVENESIIDELDFSNEDWYKYQQYLENVPKVDASFPAITVENDLMIDIKLSLPTSGFDPGIKLNREKIVKYSFENVKVRILDNNGALMMRKILDDRIDELDKKGIRSFKKEVGKLKRTYIVEALYYANHASVIVQKGFGLRAEAEAKIMGIKGIEVKAKIDSNGNHSYVFSGESNVPFAAKVIALNKL